MNLKTADMPVSVVLGVLLAVRTVLPDRTEPSRTVQRYRWTVYAQHLLLIPSWRGSLAFDRALLA